MSTTTHAPTTAAEEFEKRQHSPAQRVQHLLHSHAWLSPAIVLVVSIIVFGILNGNFIRATNLSLVLQQVAVIAALGLGQTLVILTAGIDLSVGALMIFV